MPTPIYLSMFLKHYFISQNSWFSFMIWSVIIIFLQKFLVIKYQVISEYSHNPLDSYGNDYWCPVL